MLDIAEGTERCERRRSLQHASLIHSARFADLRDCDGRRVSNSCHCGELVVYLLRRRLAQGYLSTTMSSTARSNNQKKVVIRAPSRQESDEESNKFDEMPTSQASMTSSDAGCVQSCLICTHSITKLMCTICTSLVAVVAQQMKGFLLYTIPPQKPNTHRDA